MHVPAFAVLALAAIAKAVTVEAPSTGDNWVSGNSQTVEWKAVSTDPTSFAIQLVNQQGYLSDSPVTLVSSQDTGSSDQTNSVTVTYPSGSWPTGKGFQINLVTISNGNTAILAQSGQFNITSGGSSSSSSASSTKASTVAAATTSASKSSSTKVSTSTIPAVTAGSNEGSTSSGSILNSTSKAAGLLSSQPSVFISVLMGAAALIGVTF